MLCARQTLKALIETSRRAPERVFLVGLELKSRTTWDLQDSLAELEELASTAGGEVIGNGTQKLDVPVASTFIGSGKAGEFAKQCRSEDVDTVIFDDELSPAQSRNLERVFDQLEQIVTRRFDPSQAMVALVGRNARIARHGDESENDVERRA